MSRAEPAAPTPRTRMSAEDRRAMVVAAAVSEFSEHGFEGTATEAIATRAGVSQPYLFQLFGSKRDLFIATVREAFTRTWRSFEAAGEAARNVDPSPQAILHAMGEAYCDLLRDRALLRCQLHAYAACADDEIRAAVRAEFSALHRRVAALSGAPAEVLDTWFAHGMLMNTIAAIAPDLTEDGENLTLALLTPVEGPKPRAAIARDKAQAVAEAAARAADKSRALGRRPVVRKSAAGSRPTKA
ncbi:MAG: TetR/AcrR family transcriptional regulator [Bauldia sp.]|nr:TetR/AcrR family transcriptional regulator [Bauldia sp.]